MCSVCDESYEFSLWSEIQFVISLEAMRFKGQIRRASDGSQPVPGAADYFMVRVMNPVSGQV